MPKKLWKCARCAKEFPDAKMTKNRWACKACWRAYMRFRRYGIAEAEYEALTVKQGGKCAIGGGENLVLKKDGNHVLRLAVDHDASTGRVRGLLCSCCNRGLGYFKENPSLLSRAARYLVGWEK